jgi:transposase-like protein
MPAKYSRLSKRKRKKILECFALDLTATQTATLVGVQRKTINEWFGRFREYILHYQEKQVGVSSGEFELDESYFGGPKKKLHAEDRRKRGRGAENKVPVFGIKKRSDGKVYVQVIENASRATLFPIVRRLIK